MVLPQPGKSLELVKRKVSAMSQDEYTDLLASGGLSKVGPNQPDAVLESSGWHGLSTMDVDAIADPAPTPDPIIPLNAYLACALTGLDEAQRQHVFLLSHMVQRTCVDYAIELYEPRNVTDPVHNAEVPDWQVWHTDRERVVGSDLLIHLAHFPSTGSGEELSFAFDAMVPIVVVSHSKNKVSRMVTGIPGVVLSVAYAEPEDLTAQLSQVLRRIRPLLVQRKIAFQGYDVNIVGERIRQLRESRQLTREAISAASSARYPISVELIRAWETSTDRHSNMSLMHLRELAVLLNVTVADIVEPNFEDTVLSTLDRYVSRQAARGHDPATDHDRRAMVRRVLLRAIGLLED